MASAALIFIFVCFESVSCELLTEIQVSMATWVLHYFKHLTVTFLSQGIKIF